MARRRPPLEFTNSQDRWLVSYADFLTLLFAFFVVMYSTSTANNGDYRVLSDSIVRAFGLPGVSFAPDSVGDASSTAMRLPPMRSAANDYATPAGTEAGAASAQPTRAQQALRAQESLDERLGGLLPPGALAVAPDSEFVDIALPAELLFPSGARALLASAVPLLARIAEALGELPNEIVVQGHTDNQPIRNGLFPSNWELSTARAAAVVRVLESEGIDAARLSAQGYAATRPLASNDSDEGRELNRRVVIRVRAALGASDAADNG